MADEPHFQAGRHERTRGRFDRDTTSRHVRNVKIEKIDPWFMKPYEAGAPVTPAAPKSDSPQQPAIGGSARKVGVGALLGGLAKKT